ncbi:MAG: hypothetical protein ACPGO3_00185 [Magnetospiraceae bacterium]
MIEKALSPPESIEVRLHRRLQRCVNPDEAQHARICGEVLALAEAAMRDPANLAIQQAERGVTALTSFQDLVEIVSPTGKREIVVNAVWRFISRARRKQCGHIVRLMDDVSSIKIQRQAARNLNQIKKISHMAYDDAIAVLKHPGEQAEAALLDPRKRIFAVRRIGRIASTVYGIGRFRPRAGVFELGSVFLMEHGVSPAGMWEKIIAMKAG